MFFNFETAQLTNIWNDRRQLQSRLQVQIFAVTYFWYTYNRIVE